MAEKTARNVEKTGISHPFLEKKAPLPMGADAKTGFARVRGGRGYACHCGRDVVQYMPYCEQRIEEPILKPEWNDIYDEDRQPTGRVHLRGTPWKPGEYGLVVCVWVYDGRGRLLTNHLMYYQV